MRCNLRSTLALEMYERIKNERERVKLERGCVSRSVQRSYLAWRNKRSLEETIWYKDSAKSTKESPGWLTLETLVERKGQRYTKVKKRRRSRRNELRGRRSVNGARWKDTAAFDMDRR